MMKLSNLAWFKFDDPEILKRKSFLKNDLLIENKYAESDMFGETVPYIDLLEIRGNEIGVPIHYAVDQILPDNGDPDSFIEERNKKYCRKIFDLTLELGGKNFEHQISSVDSIIDTLGKDWSRSCIFKSPTGSGKSLVILDVTRRLRTTNLIIVNRLSLLNQWRDRILNQTTLQEEDINLLSEDTMDKEAVFTLTTGQTLISWLKRGLSARIKDRYSCIILDELHNFAPEKMSEILKMFTAMYRIGLSATTERRDGLHGVYYKHLGPVAVKVSSSSINTEVRFRYLTTPVKSYFNYNTGEIMISRMINFITGSMKSKKLNGYGNTRNIEISRDIISLHREGRNILVLSDRLDQLDNIEKLLNFPGEIGKFIGGIPEEEQQRIANDCGIILATYGAMKEGIDIPKLDTLIFASPRADVVQAVGRIQRYLPSKDKALIIDYIDLNDFFQKLSSKRKKFYESNKFSIISESGR